MSLKLDNLAMNKTHFIIQIFNN